MTYRPEVADENTDRPEEEAVQLHLDDIDAVVVVEEAAAAADDVPPLPPSVPSHLDTGDLLVFLSSGYYYASSCGIWSCLRDGFMLIIP